MKLQPKKFFLILLIFILNIGLFACSEETTTYLTFGTSGFDPTLGVYQDVDEFFNNNSEQRYMSVLIEYSHMDLDNSTNALVEYDTYYGIDFDELYMSKIVASLYQDESIPKEMWIEAKEGVLYINDANTQSVLANTDIESAFNNYVNIDYSDLTNIYNSDVITSFSGSRFVMYEDYNRFTEDLSSIYNFFPILSIYEDIDNSRCKVDFDIRNNVLTVELEANYNVTSIVDVQEPSVSAQSTNITIEITFPDNIMKVANTSETTGEPYLEPSLSITPEELTYFSYDYSLDITDPDNVLNIESVSIYKDNILVNEDLSAMSIFTDLEPDTTYQIKVNANYDLNDGEGVQNIQYISDFTTLSKPNPNIQVNITHIGRETLSFKVVSLLEGISINVDSVSISEGTNTLETKTNQTGIITFRDLTADTQYMIDFDITYDLNDGYGPTSIKRDLTLRTQKPSPVEVKNIVSTSTTITFDIIRNDYGVGEILDIQLLDYSTDEVIAEITDFTNLSNLQFTGLTPGHEYKIYINYRNTNAGVGDYAGQEGYYRVETEVE